MKYFAMFCFFSCSLFGMEIDIFNPQSLSTTVEKSPFRGPRGERGDRGHRGHKGDRGRRGPTGYRGPTGTGSSVGTEFAVIPYKELNFFNARFIEFRTDESGNLPHYQATSHISITPDIQGNDSIAFTPEGYGKYVGRMQLWIQLPTNPSSITLSIKANGTEIDRFVFLPIPGRTNMIVPAIFTFEASNTSNNLSFALSSSDSEAKTIQDSSRLVLHKIDELNNT